MIKLENVPNYGMFTDCGNLMVDCIVNKARRDNLTFKQAYGLMCDLADMNYDRFGEVMDTAVREAVYNALNVETV
jgi:hypothetical protein